jgi:hypothetical protein
MSRKFMQRQSVERWSDARLTAEWNLLVADVMRAGWQSEAQLPTYYLQNARVMGVECQNRFGQGTLFEMGSFED